LKPRNTAGPGTSRIQAGGPLSGAGAAAPAIETLVEAKQRDIGGFSVRRVLPSARRRLVGPFIFFDHMGPAAFPAGQGIDVRPHPHINLATVTYLFEGEIIHRDSLGSLQAIRPGAINWMTAGRGIVHSERTDPETRKSGSRLHGVQLWVALPCAHEETEPEFRNYPAATLPDIAQGSSRLRVLAGSAYGVASPVRTLSPLFYVEAAIPAGGELPLPEEHRDRAAYVVEGVVSCGDERIEAARMAVFAPGPTSPLRAESAARVMLLGGAPLDGERHIWWNFVSSSRERIEQAKRDWKEGRFQPVPGETESIPLPER
jgi:redox-sensitive bicupin YhaK (pirin superfamily)